jgi:hypothetical protein
MSDFDPAQRSALRSGSVKQEIGVVALIEAKRSED